MPIASMRQFIELAVNSPAQLPHVGQALLLELEQSSSSVIVPARDLAHGGEHGVEVDRLALGAAAGEHRPAGDDDGRAGRGARRP